MNLDQFVNDESIAAFTAFALRAIGALVVLFMAWIVAAWLRSMLQSRLEKLRFDLTLTKFFANMLRYAILILALLSCLRIFGVDTTSFAAVIAAAGFAIGLALQGTLQNFSAGVMLLAFRPFKVGDAVKVGGELGLINEIELFTTRMDTFDNRRIILPNSQIFGATIENISFHPVRRVDVAVGTAYEADIDETRAVLEKTAEEVEGRLPDRDAQVILSQLGGSSIDWEVRVWTESSEFLAVKQRLTRNVKVALDKAGISIPYPQMDVHHSAIE
ncbi:MAG: mechanosensitive ion channel [Acidobacteria bacterium]|nr:mechanosensitive ion channel [Acidobacteriota bacterium]